MNGAYRIAIAMMVAVLSAAGCHPKEPVPATRNVAQVTLVTITRTGGIAGVNDKAFIFSDGWFNIHKHHGTPAAGKLDLHGSVGHGQLSSELMDELNAALDATAGLGTDYPAPDTADGFEYTLTHRGRTVRWNEAADNAPPALSRVAAIFTEAFASERR